MKRLISLFFLLLILFFPRKVMASATFTLDPQSGTHNIGDIFPVDVKINTGGQGISTASFRITYPFSGLTPEVDVVDSSGNSVSSGAITINTSLPGVSQAMWTFPIDTATREGNVLNLDFSAIYTDTTGFSTTSDVALGRFYLKVNGVPSQNPKILHFDPSLSAIRLKADAANNILATPTDGSYQIGGATPPNTSSSIYLKNGWNNIIFPDVSGKRSIDLPSNCIVVLGINRGVSVFVKGFLDTVWNFVPGYKYYIMCRSDVSWAM